MELKIYWTDFAKKELQKIFNYYKENASLNVARNIVIGITKEATKLQKQATIGQREELLEHSTKEFRYFIYKSYKIIYWVNSENNSIEIFDVFDSRQNPVSVKLTK
jgi:plasmid stabilization system protein ParE